MRRLLILAALAASLLCAEAWGTLNANAADPLTPQERLNAIASVFAMKPVEILCQPPPVYAGTSLVWGWTYAGGTLATIDKTLCDAATHPDTAPDWRLAVGIEVIVHESGHMRGAPWSPNEAKTDCFAMRHFRYAAQMFLIPADRIERLWSWAAAAHFRLGQHHSEYASAHCDIGWPW